MFDVHVWIASHLEGPSRLRFFQVCLQSLQNQTRLPDKVYIAYSFDSSKITQSKEEIEEILKKSLGSDIPVIFIYSEKKKSQFEHLRTIGLISNDSNSFIMFCDDDDINTSCRIEKQTQEMVAKNLTVSQTYVQCLNLEKGQQMDAKNFTLIKGRAYRTDFAATMIRRSLWDKWEDDRKNGRTLVSAITNPNIIDMLFTSWIHREGKRYGFIREILYAIRYNAATRKNLKLNYWD